MSSQSLALCKRLYQATISCKQQCEKLVPSAFNAVLLEALQHLMLAAVQLQQEEQLQAVRDCLEAVLQLLIRVSSLGPIEAFFVADELVTHYQWHLNATHALLCRLGAGKDVCCSGCKAATTPAAASAKQQQQGQNSQGCSRCNLRLPEQQQAILQSFQKQAANLCPMLVQSCPAAELQQLCDTVKHGLVLVNGHSFLLGQWQGEVSAMLARAEQLKVLLAHRQAHHLALLASALQHLHLQEVQQFDRPRSSSPSKRPQTPSVSVIQHETGQLCGGSLQQQPLQQLVEAGSLIAGCQVQGMRQVTPAQPALQEQHNSTYLAEEDLGEPDEDDEFFLPVAPLPGSSGSAGSSPGAVPVVPAAAAGLPVLPYHLPQQNSGKQTSDGDSLARTPSSGCSSLLEYVQNSLGPARDSSSQQHPDHAVAWEIESSPQAAFQAQQQELYEMERQLLTIAGSPEVAAVLASALGFEEMPCSRSSSHCGSISVAGAGLRSCAVTAAGGYGPTGLAVSGRESSTTSSLGSPQHSRPASMLGRLSSATSKALVEGLTTHRGSSGGSALRPQQQGHKWRRPQKASKALCLQHMQLPLGFCKSLGAVCYICLHLKQVVLVDCGLGDHEVGDLVDALKVNSSVQHLDLSYNKLEDIGARVLATLLRPSAGCSSRLRTLHLQHNQIGDDGAAALAHSLASSSGLQRLWLHGNAVGEAGANALCEAMQHNTACTELKLQPGNEDVTVQLAQTVQQLARQNRGAREHIKGLLKMMHLSSS